MEPTPRRTSTPIPPGDSDFRQHARPGTSARSPSRPTGPAGASPYTEYLNSFATVYVDGKKVGPDALPRRRGGHHRRLPAGANATCSRSRVVALPLGAEVIVFNDTMAPGRCAGQVARKGLCGDVYLVGTPAGARIDDVKVDTSVRKWQITFDTALTACDPDATYACRRRSRDERQDRRRSSPASPSARPT